MNGQMLANQALQHHRQGNLSEAVRLYRAALKGDGRNAQLLAMLGIALAQQGLHREALPALDQALAIDPKLPDALFARAQLLMLLGRAGQALADCERGLAIAPGHPTLLLVQANALSALERFEDAVKSYDRVVAQGPNPEALNNRGNALRAMGRDAAALESYDQALRLKPDYFDVLHNRAGLLRKAGRADAALANYDAALRLEPTHTDAMLGRARALRDLGRDAEAEAAYRAVLAGAPPTGSDDAASGLAEMLYAQGRIGDAFAMFRARAERVAKGTPLPAPSPSQPHRARHDSEQAAWLKQDVLRFHLDAGARIAGGAVNAALPRDRIQHTWQTAWPQIIVVDDLLTPEALESLRRFCRASTIWDKSYDAGYLGTVPERGFACPLLAQIAEEFPRALPEVFRHYPLKYLWAFKYDSTLSGINIHADFAAVNVNFWITPDDANLDPDAGGLVVWDKAAPLDWDFDSYNSDDARIRAFLAQAGAKPVTVPYRANRAVIFDSDLFHETDRLSFREGYENRRINVTLLYGEREAHAQEA